MKQILQNLGNGETLLAEVPCPNRGSGSVLIQTTHSLVSLGTEKMLIDFGKAGLLAKAKSQPDKVKQVLQKIRTDGFWTTFDAVKAKLDSPIPLGYCNVGTVVETDEPSRFAVGDRVISNGYHAEMVSVPENLIARIPPEVSGDNAAYTVVSAIGLQGIRLLQPSLGERIVVCGLGLIGLLTVQMLLEHGCEVLGIDFDPHKLKLAESYGAKVVDLSNGEDPIRSASHWTAQQGVDGVIITASTTSDSVIHQAAEMCRKRGRIVLVGVVGLNLQRSDFYEKEISFQVSCSYGPGRYDPKYEKQGFDYPIGFVRWTEQRNFEAVLQLMKSGKLNPQNLTTHRYPFSESLSAYETIHDPGAMGILLEYDTTVDDQVRARTLKLGPAATAVSELTSETPAIALIGAGAYATRMLLPLLPRKNLIRHSVTSETGVSASHAARKFGFARCGTDVNQVLEDDSVNAVLITTPHNTHADLAVKAIQHGKHVFLEKPLGLTDEELKQIEQALSKNPEVRLMVGFNRRYSPHSVAVKDWLKNSPGPKAMVITVNAGRIPMTHWTQDLSVGGGRILGEACHFIDLARHLAGHSIVQVNASALSHGDGAAGDCAAIQLVFSDGTIATVHYLSNGSKSFPKERIEVFCGGQVAVIENFRRSVLHGGRSTVKTRGQDKGHRAALAAFFQIACSGGKWPIASEELFEVGNATIDAHLQVRRQLSQSD